MIVHDDNDLVIGPKTLWAEARGETQIGQEAVAWVILNRASRVAYAGSLLGQAGAIAKVCLAPWQFSCWNEDAADEGQRAALLTPLEEDYATQYDTFVDCVDGLAADPTGGADCYYAPALVGKPVWTNSMRFCGRFGSQLFYDSTHGPANQHRVLYAGCQGTDVTELEKALLAKGCYFGVVNDTFDVTVQTAVEEYQRRVGLVIDGVAGPKTYSSLGLYGG